MVVVEGFQVRFVPAVPRYLSVPDDETVDSEVEPRLMRGVFGRKRVEYKLEIGFCRRIFLIEVELGREDLCGSDGDPSPHQVGVTELGRQPRSPKHVLASVVEYGHIVDDDTVEKAHIHATHRHGRTEFPGDGGRHSGAQCRLYDRDMHHDYDGKIESYRQPDEEIDDSPNLLQVCFRI